MNWTNIDKKIKLLNMSIVSSFHDIYPPPKVINRGTIIKADGESVPYYIELGLSKESILECNKWKDYVTDIIMKLIVDEINIEDNKDLLQNDIMLEDYHWNWLSKASKYATAEYDWFFLKTTDGVQGVCVTFHPKKSVFQSVNIFYIEYLSSAPWNRHSSLHDRQYKGIATEIIKQIQYYFIKTHLYNHGFNLHSLFQSQGFYEHIGMINVPEHNKKHLLFYEMNKENAIIFLEGKNAKTRN